MKKLFALALVGGLVALGCTPATPSGATTHSATGSETKERTSTGSKSEVIKETGRDIEGVPQMEKKTTEEKKLSTDHGPEMRGTEKK